MAYWTERKKDWCPNGNISFLTPQIERIVVNELSTWDSLNNVVSLDAQRLAKDLRSRLDDIPGLFARHVPQARQMLRKLLDGHILCEPIVEGGKAGYRFTATGTFDRLLTGFKVINDGGGGHPQPDLFCPTIRVPLRTPRNEGQKKDSIR